MATKMKGIGSKGIGGYKMPKKSWDSSEINRESQDKKIVLVMIAVIVAVILMSLLMWSIKSSML